jgi:hypothetical protein
MNEEQFIEQLEQYEGKWVSILETKAGRTIVGSGHDAVEAKRAAEEAGYEEVILLKVIPVQVSYIPSA